MTKILVSLLASGVLVLILWLVRGAVLMPVYVGKNAEISAVLTVKGPCPELEGTVNSLLWLRQNGTLKADITVFIENTDESTERAAIILSQQENIKLIFRGNL